jgi:hypothetical protein
MHCAVRRRFLGGVQVRSRLLVLMALPLVAMLLLAGLWAPERNVAVEQTLGSVSRVRAVSQANALVVALHSEGG